MIGKASGKLFSAVMLLGLSAAAYSQTAGLRFQDLTIAEGLSNNTVKCILRDSRGFMWFGTPNGINKYDGYGFTVYRNAPGAADAPSCLDVLSMCEDNRGHIWVGAKSCGVYIYDREKDQVERFARTNDSTKSFNNLNVRAILQDSASRVWIGTENGLYAFRHETGELAHYQHHDNDSTSLSDPTIYSLLQDRKNRLWIGTANGLNLFDQKTGRFRRYFDDPKQDDNTIQNIYADETGNLWMGTYFGGVIRFNPEAGAYKRFVYDKRGKNTISSNNIFSLTGDGQGHLYFGTENGGLNVLDLKTAAFSYYTFKLEEAGGITNNSIYSLYYSSDGMLWAGTYSGGVNYASQQSQGFRHYKAAKERLNYPYILSITESKDGNLWIGTDGGGLNYFDRESGKYTYYLHDENNPRSLGANVVATVFEDQGGHIWVGLYQAGLDLFAPQTKSFTHFRHAPGNNNTLQSNSINTLFEDSRGNFYAGTHAGLDCFDRRTGTFKRSPYNSITTGVLSIIEDRQENLWVGTYNGLTFIDVKADTAKNYSYVDESREIVRSVAALHEDSQGHLWVGTMDGLYHFDRKSQQFLHCPLDDKHLNNEIGGIVEDDDGNLWISNNHSLLKLEGAVHRPENPVVVNFGIYSGSGKTTLGQASRAPTDAKIGPDGKLYLPGNNRAIDVVDLATGAVTRWIQLPASKVVKFGDFDANGYFYTSGTRTDLMIVAPDLTTKAAGVYPTTTTGANNDIIAVRVCQGYVYVATRSSATGPATIWRHAIGAGGTVGPQEMVIDMNATAFASQALRAILFSANGTMYLATDSTDPILLVDPTTKNVEILYKGILSPYCKQFCWGTGTSFYMISGDTILGQVWTVFRVNAGFAAGAP